MFKVINREEQAHDGPIWSLGISSKGSKENNNNENQFIVTGSVDDTVKAWQWIDDTLTLKYIFEGHALGVMSIDINNEGNIAASASLDSHIRLWDLISGNQVQCIDAGPVDSWTICFSPDSKLVATGCNSKVNMFSSETGKLVTSIDTSGKFTLALAFSPDGKTIATGAIDGMIQIFDIESKMVINTLEPHAMPVRSIAFSPDGKYLASASDDYNIKIFEVDKADPISTLSGHGSWVLNVTFSPDGKHFASSSSDIRSKRIHIKNFNRKSVKLDTRKVNSIFNRIEYFIENSPAYCSEKFYKTSTSSSCATSSLSSSPSSSSQCTMTSHSSIGHSKHQSNIHCNQSKQNNRQYQRSFSEDLEPSKILETGDTTCCPTDAPTIAQALWRPLWPPGWRPRGSSLSSTNKCTTNTKNFHNNINSSKRSTVQSNNSNNNNCRSDFNSITGTTGNTLKNIFKRPLIIMSEHREDARSFGSSSVSITNSGTGNEDENGKRGVGVNCIVSGKLGGAGESEVLLGKRLSEKCVSGNSAINVSSSTSSSLNCSQSKSQQQQQQQQQQSSINQKQSTTAPNNRLITLSTGRLRLGPTSNDVSSSLEEYESMEAWLDEHPKFLCDYVIRKAPRSTIDAWILAHSIPHSAGSSCGTSSASAPASGAATPVRKISAHEFEKGSLFLPPMVSTTEEGIPTFLQPPTRDDYHPSSSYLSSSNQHVTNLHSHYQQQYFSSNLSTTEYSYLSSSSLGPSLTLRQPQLTSSSSSSTTSSSSTSTSSSSSSAAEASAAVASALKAIISSSSSLSTPLTDISSPSSSVQRSRSQFDGLDEKQLIFELVKDIYNDLDVVSLNHKILKNVSLLTNADRCSLFLVKGEPGDPNRHFVPTLFDVSSKPASSSTTTTTTTTTTNVTNNNTQNASLKLESIKVAWGQGIVGYVAESGESVIIDDCYKDSRFSDLVDQMTGFKTRNMLCSPIFDNYGQVMGVAQVINKLPKSRLSIPSAGSLTINNNQNNTNNLSVCSNNVNNSSNNNINNNNTSVSFTLDDQRIFNQYLQFCGIGLRNAQLFERSQLENKRNQVLLDLARMVFEEQSTIDQIVYRIMVHIQSLLGCERCQVLLVSESSSPNDFDPSNEIDMIETESVEHQTKQQLEIPDNNNYRDVDDCETNSRTFSRVFDLSMDDLTDKDKPSADDNNNNNNPPEDKSHEDSKMNETFSTTNNNSTQLPTTITSSPSTVTIKNHPFEGRFPINIGITGYVATTGETLNIPNAYEDSRFDISVDSFDHRGFVHKSILCMPIRNANRRIIGVSQLINKLNGQPFNKNDENLFEAFAIFCGMGIHNTQMYEKAMKAMAKQRVTFECLSYHATSRREEAIALSREPIPSTQALRLGCLDFHDFSLENDDKMVKACIRMFLDLDLINRFSIDYPTLCRWLLSVRKNYRPVTYHNWRHAFNVAQMMFAILVSTSLCNSLGELDTLALIMACLCHDLDHRGTNNSFQIKSSSPLATLYSTSTMEHHHFDQSLMILNSEGNQILSNLSPAEYKRVVRVMEEAILATDLVVYFTNRESFVRLIESGDYHWDSNESDKQLLRGMLMTACDIAAITKPWEVQKVVAELVATEFFQQGDIEKEKLNLQPIDMMNREKKDELPRLQVSFIDSICLPIYSAFSSLYPTSLSPLRQGVITNKRNWLYQALEHPSLKDWALEEMEKLEKSDQPLIGNDVIENID